MVTKGQKHPDQAMRDQWRDVLYAAQANICKALEEVDGGKFRSDKWERGSEGGGGKSCVIQDGNVFEKAGVNVSVVHGDLPREAIRDMCSRGRLIDHDVNEPMTFFAGGLSLVIHPRNPMAPTAHANYRLFQVFKKSDEVPLLWWFGGGADLTPSYIFEEDCIYFHKIHADMCNEHDETYYPKFKVWCDYYFRNHHRNEARGVGGIFFDDLNEGMKDPQKIFNFCKAGLAAFPVAYAPIVAKRKNALFTEEQKRWQQLRRGRYTEFNLIHDRGTKFGLHMPDSRVESILMSLPLTARWEYDVKVDPKTDEGKALALFRKNKDWVPFDRSIVEGFVVPLEETPMAETGLPQEPRDK